MIIFESTQLALDRYFRMANLRAVDTSAGLAPGTRVSDDEFRRQHARAVAHLKANGASKIVLTPGMATFATPRNNRAQVIENKVGSV